MIVRFREPGSREMNDRSVSEDTYVEDRGYKTGRVHLPWIERVNKMRK